MANIILNGKTVVTQTGNDEPLIGGNVVFPAGHVIQTFVEIDGIGTSTDTTTYVTPFTGIDITMIGNNKVLVMVFFSGFTTASTSARAYFRLAQTLGGSTTHYPLARDVGYSVTDIRMPVSMAHQTGALSSGATYTFNVEFQSVSSSGAVSVNVPYDNAGYSTLVVQEIKV